MSDTRIGEICSRLRNGVKAETQSSFLTDKYMYSLFLKYASVRIKQLDDKGRLYAFSSIFETLDWVQLEECDWIEAGCRGVKSYRTFRKTTLSLPMFMEGKYGPMVRSITSLDGRTPFTLTSLDSYVLISNQPNYRFNKTKYCWWLNDHLYFPNVDYPAVRIEGMFQDDISAFKCGSYEDRCKPRQEQSLNIPDYILAEIEDSCIKYLNGEMRIPEQNINNNQSPLR